MACAAKWWTPRMNQPPHISWLIKKTLPQAVDDDGL